MFSKENVEATLLEKALYLSVVNSSFQIDAEPIIIIIIIIIIMIIIIILYLTTCHLGAESSFKRERETNYINNKLIRTDDKR